jgi:hypothetical protein
MKKALVLAAIVLTVLIVLVLLIRLFSPAHLDDVSPGIPCEEGLYKKGGILFVIPKYNDTNISDNPEWCEKILALNKTIGMHGVYHTYEEFMTFRDEKYVDEGIVEFEKCFGFKPELFKPPQMAYDEINKRTLEKFHVVKYFEQIFHKEFHCNDTGALPNWAQDLI